MQVTDSDSVTTNVNWDTSTFIQRLGRLILKDSYGPETSPLEMQLRAEYFDGTQWSANTLDSCSTYSENIVSLDPASYTGNLSSGETTVVAIGSQTILAGFNASNTSAMISIV